MAGADQCHTRRSRCCTKQVGGRGCHREHLDLAVSTANCRGPERARLDRVMIQQHRRGKGEERRLYMDHYPAAPILRLCQQCEPD